MRKETSNQFSEGLISDLNPINTPKTALTDNLNGTIITYNGNEFSLQNDRGNYELKNCKLKPNYIPVGIKEHGDILYIVSYNPLDESVEVGSYPSPLQVNEIEAESDELDFGSIIKSEIIDGPKTKGYNNYSKLVTKEKYIVFNGEDYKLYPGDMYKLETGSDSPYRYEKFEYFILDEESNTHNITEEIKNPKTVDENGFSYVGWDIPGWITAKARLAKLSSAGLNIRSFYAPEIDENTREVYYDFILRLNIDDELLKERIFVDSIYQREVKFVIEISGEKPKIIDSCELSEWYSDNKIIWKSISGNMTAGKNDVITVKMTPILTEKHKDGEYTIVYDNLKQEQEFDLSRVNDKPWTAGESLYKYYVSSDKTKQHIEFIVDGPKVSSSQIDLQYRIKTIDGDYIIGNSNSWDTFPNYYGIGSNYVSIPFTEEFKKENIYILEWRFFSVDGYTRNLPSRLLITSELLTGAEKESVYDRDITMDYLVGKYFATIENSIEMNLLKTKISEDVKITSENESVITYLSDIDYNTFVAENNMIPAEFTANLEKDIVSDFEIHNAPKYLTGDLWKGIFNYSVSYNDEIVSNAFDFKTSVNNKQIVKLVGSAEPIESFNFYRVQWGENILFGGIPSYELSFEHSSGATYNFKWKSLNSDWEFITQTYTIPEFINEFQRPFKTPALYRGPKPLCYKLKLDGVLIYPNGAPSELLIFPGLINKKSTDDNLSYAISKTPIGIFDAMLGQLYAVYDENGEFTAHRAVYSKISTDPQPIDYKFNTSFKFNESWSYNGMLMKNLELDVLYTKCLLLTDFNSSNNNEFVHEESITDLSNFNSLTDEIQKRVDLFSANKQLESWKSSPVYINKHKKQNIRGLYCYSDNEKLNNLVKILDKEFDKTNEDYGLHFSEDFITNKFLAGFNSSQGYSSTNCVLNEIGVLSDYLDDNSDILQ